MEFVLRRKRNAARVSIVLIDWSCRESFHALDYLNDQTVDRDAYEIIWIEYYKRREPEIMRRITGPQKEACPALDSYVIMEMPRSLCYHKHLMYNLGIVLASGDLVCIADSDALFRPTFVESVIRTFEENEDIVLHYDQVRNNDRRFWPFRRPYFDDVTSLGCINWVNGRPLGLVDTIDPLHTKNYGACMCARRDDLIAIGGADLHRDYLGHICGPYELTFRLRNFGRRELWHQSEWLYHVWHPGQGGDGNYVGPHDGRHMSATALKRLESSDWRPHVESPAVARIREGKSVKEAELVEALVPPDEIQHWEAPERNTVKRHYDIGGRRIDTFEQREAGTAPSNRSPPILGIRFKRRSYLWLVPLMIELVWEQLLVKYRVPTRLPSGPGIGKLRIPFQRTRSFVHFLRRQLAYNRDGLKVCWRHLCYANQIGARDLVLYGDGTAARILCTLSRFLPVRIRGICPFCPTDAPSRYGKPLKRIDELPGSPETVLCASFTDTASLTQELARAGVETERIMALH